MLKVDQEIIQYNGQASTRESFPRCTSEPLAIISITLQGLADDGPPKVAYEHIVPYLRGNACYVNIDFNFGTDQDSQSFSKRLDRLADCLEKGELKRYVNVHLKYLQRSLPKILSRFQRFFVFLCTHSGPERGDLHMVPNEQ